MDRTLAPESKSKASTSNDQTDDAGTLAPGSKDIVSMTRVGSGPESSGGISRDTVVPGRTTLSRTVPTRPASVVSVAVIRDNGPGEELVRWIVDSRVQESFPRRTNE